MPGFLHDVCSAVHPLAVASPFFRTLPLAEHGLRWVHPQAPLAHPFDDGTATLLESSIEATGETLGKDAARYRELMEPLVADWEYLSTDILAPPRMPRHPLAFARFGWRALRSAVGFARGRFDGPRAQALFAGLAAHSMLPLERLPRSAIAPVLAITGHAGGWPMPRGGSQKIADALASYLHLLGGRISTGVRVEDIAHLPSARAIFCDLTPRQVLRVAGHSLPKGYLHKLKHYRYGVGVYKIDWRSTALSRGRLLPANGLERFIWGNAGRNRRRRTRPMGRCSR